MEQPPSSAPTPAPAAGEPSPPSSAPPGAPAPAPATGAPQSPAAPPADPYRDLDYQAMIEQHDMRGMDAAELSHVFGPAHEAITEVAPNLRAVFEGSHAGNDPGLIRSLASYGQTYRSMKADEQALTAEVRQLARDLGVPAPPLPRPTPLEYGQGLREAVQRLVNAHVGESATQRLVAELRRDPDFEAGLSRLAQEDHARRQRLLALTAQRDDLRAQADAPSATRELPDGSRLSNAELDILLQELGHQLHVADRENSPMATPLKQRYMMLQRIRFGGDAA
jgi:hypothetical protein